MIETRKTFHIYRECSVLFVFCWLRQSFKRPTTRENSSAKLRLGAVVDVLDVCDFRQVKATIWRLRKLIATAAAGDNVTATTSRDCLSQRNIEVRTTDNIQARPRNHRTLPTHRQRPTQWGHSWHGSLHASLLEILKHGKSWGDNLHYCPSLQILGDSSPVPPWFAPMLTQAAGDSCVWLPSEFGACPAATYWPTCSHYPWPSCDAVETYIESQTASMHHYAELLRYFTDHPKPLLQRLLMAHHKQIMSATCRLLRLWSRMTWSAKVPIYCTQRTHFCDSRCSNNK